MLYEKLSQYAKGDMLPLHMPGHKRNTDLLKDALPYSIDVSEIYGFDNLHDSGGILRDTARAAAALYGSDRAFLLVNGSTGGILAAIRASVQRGGKIIIARNCHRSVYHAAELCCLRTAYLLPEADAETGIAGSVTPEQLSAALSANPDARLVVVTCPTYEGVVSDIRSLAEIAHRARVPLMVDQAHGAHLGFSDFFPEGAVAQGADIVITSLHKTLPALTPCALAHVTGELADAEEIGRQLAVFETSSPSYVLMASAGRCIGLLSGSGRELFYAYEARLRAFDDAVSSLKKLRVLCYGDDTVALHPSFYGFDPGKLVIYTGGTNMTGGALMELLRNEHHIELEMALDGYAVAMTSICDSDESLLRLAGALHQADRLAEGRAQSPLDRAIPPVPRQAMPLYRAVESRWSRVPLGSAVGCVSRDYIWAYPPGIPLLAPGEVIDLGLAERMRALLDAGIPLRSSAGGPPKEVRVCTGDDTQFVDNGREM